MIRKMIANSGLEPHFVNSSHFSIYSIEEYIL